VQDKEQDTEQESKARNREIARNESARQTRGNIRVSGWAIAVALVIACAALALVLMNNR
jgi:fatty acid desaturase